MESQAALFCRELKFRNAAVELRNRTGLLIRKRTDSRHPWSYGEASPIDSHSQDSIADCLAWLSGEKSQEPPASLRFAMSTLENWEAVAFDSEARVHSSALLDLGVSSSDLYRYLERGFRVFKLKISPKNLHAAADLMRAALDRRSDLLFRLDANQSFDPSNLNSLFKILSGLPIDYVEDPCIFSSEVFSAFKDQKISVAMDQHFDTNFPVDVAVLKPTVLGGETEISRVIGDLRQRGRRVVLSSCLETEIGRASVAFMAKKFASKEIHGITTGDFYKENFWIDLPEISTARFASGWQEWIDSLDWRGCEF